MITHFLPEGAQDESKQDDGQENVCKDKDQSKFCRGRLTEKDIIKEYDQTGVDTSQGDQEPDVQMQVKKR